MMYLKKVKYMVPGQVNWRNKYESGIWERSV